jgi:Tol biopolymer transport system component
MKRLFVLHLAILLAVATVTGSAQGSAQAEKLIASAQRKATIDGDLRGAIEDYKKAIAAAGENRTLAAQALLRMAECHQKLGEGEAHAIYERIVRDFAEQKDAVVVARARLGTTGVAAPVKGDRSLWAGHDADGFGTISPDGRFITFTDWAGGAALSIRELATGTSHRLTTGGSTQFSAISKDGRFVAYQWRDAANVRGYGLRVSRLHGTTISESRLLISNEEWDVAPFDWSPDGKWIAVGVGRPDGTHQIALASAQDGSMRVLKSLDWKEPTKVFFSPDGRFIAYDLPPGDSGTETHVFVMAVDGSSELTAAAHSSQNTIMGWSPDGKYLFFSSNRTGTFGLWAVAIENGRPSADPILVKPDVASSWSLGLTGSGTMYVWKYASPVFVQASPVDLTTGKLVADRTLFHRFITSRGRPEWSPDGKQLAFQSCAPLGSGPCTLWISSIETGSVRELKIKLGYFAFMRWSPDGRELLTRGSDSRGRNNGLYRIDVQTGDAQLVAASPGETLPNWSADGQYIYFRRRSALIERRMTSGAERTILQLDGGSPRDTVVTPDGGTVAYITADTAGDMSLWVRSTTAGSPRLLLRGTSKELLFQAQWTQDGRALVIAREGGETGTRQLWLVPVDGSAPRKLAIDVANWSIGDGYRLDSSGRQIAFVAATGQPGLEIRALENILPDRAARSSSKK